jgi:hypothetical protein
MCFIQVKHDCQVYKGLWSVKSKESKRIREREISKEVS